MADPNTDQPDGADHQEIDSVMADEVAGIEQPTSPPQSAASPGLFVPPVAPMTSDEQKQAMLAIQRQAAEQYRERKVVPHAQEADHAASPTPAGISSDDISEIVQRSKQHVNDAAAQEFARLKARYLKKKEAGRIQIEEEIFFLRAESAETARQRKLAADAAFDNPAPEDSDNEGNDLFVGPDEVPDLPDFSSDDEDKPKKRGRKRKNAAESDDEAPPKRAKKTAAKKSRKVPGQDYSEADLGKVLGKSKKSKAAPKASTSKPVSKKKAAKAGPSMTNTSNLRGTDVFREARANEHLPDQPTFDPTGRRADAMKQLIASVPTEARDTAKYDQKFLDAAIRDFTGTGSVRPAPDGNWYVRGMKTTLKHYQILGIAFMRRRETGNDLPRSGILADGMGLGKTLMSLANIVNGRPKGKGKNLRTTLIVASPALVNQWFHEIQTHCVRKSESKEHGMGGVYQHRAGHRLDSNLDMETLENADIILTTYSEVNRSYPKPAVPDHLVTAKQKDDWWKQHFEANKGILHRLKFLRVVLDEAQQIKNHKSVSSMACRALSARHCWALTGTPIYNTVSEFYSLFKFLKEPHTGSFKIFKANFCDPTDPDSIEKLNVFLRKLMVRRTHLDRLFGARLLTLPKPSETTVKLEFSEIERQVYEIVKNRMVSRINSIAKMEGQSGLQRRFSHIWTMILRLRQLCGHILLIQGTIMDILEREDFEKLNKIASSQQAMNDEGAALLVHLKHALASRNASSTVEGSNGAALSETQIVATGTVDIGDIDGDIGRGHGQSFRFQKYLKALAKSDKWTEITDRSCCVGCRQPAVNPYISDCFHIYCLQCLTDTQHLAARRGMDCARCAECGNQYTNAQPCEGLEDLAEEISGTSLSPTDTQPTTGMGGRKKKKDTGDDSWIDMSGEMIPSAKTRATKAQILVWLEEDPDAKIIVYTQFIPMIKILEKVCNVERWDHCKYTGNMSHDARYAAINEFSDNPKKKILLASLKAGGLGLNLTMASRVLLLDPWWNSAVEQQAFARVYRIGQQKETHLVRLSITNSIDAAMMAVKARKDEDIEAVMNDAKRKETLNVEDLMKLFGTVREDEGGKPFIFAEEEADMFDEGEEHLRYANADEDDEEGFMGNEE